MSLLNDLLNERKNEERIIYTLFRHLSNSSLDYIEQTNQIIHEITNDRILFNTIQYDLNCLRGSQFEGKEIIEKIIEDIETERNLYLSWVTNEIEKIKSPELSYLNVFEILIEQNIVDLDIIKKYISYNTTMKDIIKTELKGLNLIKKNEIIDNFKLDWEID